MENTMLSENDMTENGEGEKHELESIKFKTKKNVGGIRAMPFILANDVCDIFASIGWRSNMITYLTKELNMPLVKASNTLSYFSGAGNFTPLFGALIADSFAGRYWTIVVGSIIYELGLVSITILATLPQLRPPGCPSQENCKEASSQQLLLLYLALLLSSIGSGGRKPCVVTFAADQIDMSKSKVESRKWNFFNWYTFCLGMGSLAALTIVVYVQDNVGWGLGFGIPTIAMAISVIAFVVGSPLYRKVKPKGSPFVRLAQVVVAAVKKRNEVAPKDAAMLYENRELDADISNNGRLLHSDQYK
ncbi:hypothetical protein C3L33_13098, partial [Rhododendron williamsianum]